MRPAILMTFVLMLAGCGSVGDRQSGQQSVPTGPDGDESDAVSSEIEAPPGAPNSISTGTTLLRREYSGFIELRALQYPDYTGDAPGFCFTVPTDTRALGGHLTWDSPQLMGLEFMHGSDRWTSWESSAKDRASIRPPIDLRLDNPAEGGWYVYAGPRAVGARINWQLTLTWEIERSDALLEETIWSGYC